MTGGVLGGGVIFVVAALLWAAVLVPNWVRRREFRAAERNAMRLQRTLRVLAETAEVPQEVRVEATARQALAHEKLLRTAQRRQEAEREARLAEERADQVRAEIRAQQIERQQQAMRRAAKLKRPAVRGVRVTAALVTLLGVIGVFVGAGLAFAGAGTMVLIGSAVGGAVGLSTLVALAPGRVKVRPIEAENIEPPVVHVKREQLPAAPVATGETQAAAQAHAAAQQAAAERIATAQAKARARASRPIGERENQPDSILLQAAREQTEQPRNTEASAETGRSDRSAAAAAAEKRASTLAQMGVVGDTSEGMPDLDAVLRRRRAG